VRSLAVGLALLAGCDSLFGFQTVPAHDGGLVDAALDAPPDDAPPGMTCAGSLLRHCEPTQTIMGKTLTIAGGAAQLIDTDAAEGMGCDRVLSQAGGPEVCALVYDVVTIDGTVTAVGSRPLAIYAMSSLEIGGTIDVSSHAGSASLGAGADGTCRSANGAAMPTVSAMHAGGGAGGSFGMLGGAGGAGENMTVTAMPGPAFAGTLYVRGGCGGGKGGAGAHVVASAAGGGGGGGLYLATNGAATISGKLLANGAGGAGGLGDTSTGGDFHGGGAGGSGGLIVVEGMVTVAAGGLVMATGGAGGGGSYSTSAGGAGEDPDPTKPLLGASGGMSGLSGTGVGGVGGAKSAAGAGAYSTTGGGGGGGGGGGAGIVRLPANATIAGTQVP
jgi:hypothetical protein